MNLVIKYTAKNTPVVAQLTNDAAALGNTGVNFVGCATNITMTLANATAVNNSDKASIIPTVSNISDGTYVDKIVSIVMPATIDGTTINYFSTSLNNIGILQDVIGVEFLGLTRTETDTVAAFISHSTIRDSLHYSISKNRLIFSIPAKPSQLSFATTTADLVAVDANAILALMNGARAALATAFQGATINLRITYKN